MSYYVNDVFEDEIKKHYYFLRKIQEYHDETGNPIYFSIRLNIPMGSQQELKLLQNMKNNLKTYQLDNVKQYLSKTTHKTAQKTYNKTQYYKCKLKYAFIENAIQQIQEYDPFHLTMDDIHECDNFMLNLTYKKMYYEEKMYA